MLLFRRTVSRSAGRLLRGRGLRPRLPGPSEDREVAYVLEPESLDPAVRKERVLISCLAMPEPNVEPLIEAAARAVEADGRIAVIVATDLPIAYLLASARPVELLPTRSNLALMSAAEYETYLRQRWTILRAKWAIRRDIVLGRTFESFLEDQTGLPPVPEVRSGETGPKTQG